MWAYALAPFLCGVPEVNTQYPTIFLPLQAYKSLGQTSNTTVRPLHRYDHHIMAWHYPVMVLLVTRRATSPPLNWPLIPAPPASRSSLSLPALPQTATN